MKKQFDWEKFKTEKIAVHCKTEEEAKDFCREMHEQGTRYFYEDDYLKYMNYDKYKEKTCYYANGKYSSLEFAERNTSLPDKPDYEKIDDFKYCVNEMIVRGDIEDGDFK